MRPVSVILPLLLGLACTAEIPASPELDLGPLPLATAHPHHPDRVIAATHSGELPAQLQVDGSQLQLLRELPRLGAGVYALPAGRSVPELVEQARAEEQLLFLEPDARVQHTGFVGEIVDPLRVIQWNLDALEAESAWQRSGGAGITVAVVDTGVSSGPEDGLNSLLPGLDLVTDDGDAADENGHGTHVSGTIAAATGNGIGVAGLAPESDILPVRVLDADGSGYTSDVIAGILWAAAEGADVINLSLGGGGASASTAAALALLASDGVVIVAASGNESAWEVSYPAAYEGVIAVGATDRAGERTWYSNRGSELDLVAPGGDTAADVDNDGVDDGILQETFVGGSWDYWLFQGTSMATPHVSAAAAVLLGAGATGAETQELLLDSALDISAPGWDDSTGHGQLDLVAALEALEDLPLPDETPPSIDDIQWIDTGTGTTLQFTTDEEAQARLCRAADHRCADTDWGVAHELYLPRIPAAPLILLARDEAGNLGMEGPFAYAP